MNARRHPGPASRLMVDVAYHVNRRRMLLCWRAPDVRDLDLAETITGVREMVDALRVMHDFAVSKRVRTLQVIFSGDHDAGGAPYARQFEAPIEVWCAVLADLGRACDSAEAMFETPVAGHA